jgi:hypothetical protein
MVAEMWQSVQCIRFRVSEKRRIRFCYPVVLTNGSPSNTRGDAPIDSPDQLLQRLMKENRQYAAEEPYSVGVAHELRIPGRPT